MLRDCRHNPASSPCHLPSSQSPHHALTALPPGGPLLLQETLFLAVNVLDRYLSLQPVARGDLQLVGITALWLACKYEEVSKHCG